MRGFIFACAGAYEYRVRCRCVVVECLVGFFDAVLIHKFGGGGMEMWKMRRSGRSFIWGAFIASGCFFGEKAGGGLELCTQVALGVFGNGNGNGNGEGQCYAYFHRSYGFHILCWVLVADVT